MNNENLKTLYDALVTPSASTQNRALFDKSQIGSNTEEFAKILSNSDNAKTLYDALLTPKAEFGNRSLFDKSQIGSSVEDFNNIFGLKKKDIGFESSNGSVPSPLASSMYAPVQGMGGKAEKKVKNAPLVSSQYAPVEGMGMAATGGVAEFSKYLYNKLLTGTGSVVAGATDFITQAAPSYVPKEATAIAIRNSVTPYLRKIIGETIGAEQSKEQKKLYDDDFVIGSIGGLAESVPAMLIPGGIGLFAQGYDSGLQSINNSKFANDLSETEKSMFALSVGGVNSMLEKYGLDKVFSKSKAFNAFSDKLTGLIIDRLASQGKKITAKLISQEASNVINTISKKAIKSGIRITDAALIEGLTGGSQEVATIGLEEALNKYKGKAIFDNGSMGSMMGRVIKAAGQEAIGGGIMGGFASVISGDLTDKRTLASVASAPNGAEAIPVMVDEIKKQAESNQITQEEADQALQYINLSATNNFKIPDNISEEKRSEALEILNEKTVLEDALAQEEEKAKGIDPSLLAPIQFNIDDIKSQIAERDNQLKLISEISIEKPIAIKQVVDNIDFLQSKLDELNINPTRENKVERVRTEGKIGVYNDQAFALENNKEVIYRETEDGVEKEIDGEVTPISDSQFAFADLTKPEGIVIESTLEKGKPIGTISETEYNNFVDKGIVTEKRLNDIANKVKEKSKLTEKENAIFTDKTGEINAILAQEATTPLALTEEQQDKIAEIDAMLAEPDGLTEEEITNLKEEKNTIENTINIPVVSKGKFTLPEIILDIDAAEKRIDAEKRRKEELKNKPTEDATKISKEPVTQGGEQGDIVQRKGTKERQPKAGERKGSTRETEKPKADNRNRPVSSEKKQEVVEAPIPLSDIEVKYKSDPNALTKKQFLDLLNQKRERLKRATLNLAKGKLTSEQVKIKKAAILSLENIIGDIVNVINKSQGKKLKIAKKEDVAFSKKQYVIEDTESIVDEINKLEGVNIEVDPSESTLSKGKLDIKSIKNRKGLAKQPNIVTIADYKGIPIMVTISDELTTTDVVNPITGNKIDNLNGGNLFPYSKGNIDYAWAYTDIDTATDTLNVAKNIYNNNQELFDKLWADGKLPKNHIPVAVVKMGKSAMSSNEAVIRQIIDNLSDGVVPKANKVKAFNLLEGDIKNQLAVVQSRIDKADGKGTASDGASSRGYKKILDLLKDVKSFDELLKRANELDIATRPLLISRFTTGNADIVPSESRLTVKKDIAKALMEGLPKAEIKRINLGNLIDNLADKSLENVPDKHIISFVGIDISADKPVTIKTHPNYPAALKGQGLGVLEETSHLASVMPAAYGNIINKLLTAENKGKKVSGNEMISAGLPAALNNVVLRNKLISESPNDLNKIIGYLQLSFPKVQFFTDENTWGDILNSDNVKKFVKEDETVYGLTKDGHVYLNPEFSSLNTPIHEVGHIWIDLLENSNSALFNKGLDLVKGTKEFSDAVDMYGDTLKAKKEALAILIGNRGESITDAAKKSKFKEWLVGLYKYIQEKFPSLKNLTPKQVENLTLQEFIDGALKDILGAKEVSFKPTKTLDASLRVTKNEKLSTDKALSKASGTTQRENTIHSYRKVGNKIKIAIKGADKSVLDYGAGLGLGTDAMSEIIGKNVDSYEINPERWKGKKAPTYTDSDEINIKYDNIVSLNVLNVVPKNIRDFIVKDIYNKLSNGGTAYISSRGFKGDIDETKNFKLGEEDKSYIVKKKQDGKIEDVYQKGFDGDELFDYIKSILGDNAVVIKNNTFGKIGVIIEKRADDTQIPLFRKIKDATKKIELTDEQKSRKAIKEAPLANDLTQYAYEGIKNKTIRSIDNFKAEIKKKFNLDFGRNTPTELTKIYDDAKVKFLGEKGKVSMTFEDYLKDRNISYKQGKAEGRETTKAKMKISDEIFNTAIDYLKSKKIGIVKQNILKGLITKAAKVSSTKNLDLFINKVDSIMAKAEFIEKYITAQKIKKALSPKNKGNATQLIARLKTINLKYLSENDIDNFIDVSKQLLTSKPNMASLVDKINEVLSAEQTSLKEALDRTYNSLGAETADGGKFMNIKEIYQNLNKFVELNLINKDQATEVEVKYAKENLTKSLNKIYDNINEFIDSEQEIESLDDYLSLKRSIKAYNRVLNKINSILPDFKADPILLSEVEGRIEDELSEPIREEIAKFKESIVSDATDIAVDLKDYTLSKQFREDADVSDDTFTLLSSDLSAFANSVTEDVLNEMSIEEIADFMFYSEQAMEGYVHPEIYDSYNKVATILFKNDITSDLAKVIEGDTAFAKDIKKIDSEYDGAKTKSDLSNIMTTHAKHNVDSFLGMGDVNLYYNNIYQPYGTALARKDFITAKNNTEFIKINNAVNKLKVSVKVKKGVFFGKVVGSLKTSDIGKVVGYDKSMQDVKHAIAILIQQLDYISNLPNAEKAKYKDYAGYVIENKNSFIKNAKSDDATKRIEDLMKDYEKAYDIIKRLDPSVGNENSILHTPEGVEKVINKLGGINSVLGDYIKVFRKTIKSYESFTEINSIKKGEQYLAAINYAPRQYATGAIGKDITGKDFAESISKGSDAFQNLKKNSSATYSRVGDGLAPRIIDPERILQMHSNDVMMEYSLKGIIENSIDALKLAENKSKSEGEQRFLTACRDSISLMLQTEFIVGQSKGADKLIGTLLNTQNTLLVTNDIRQPSDYLSNLEKVGTSVEGAKIMMKFVEEKFGKLTNTYDADYIEELNNRDKAAYEIATQLGGEFLWSEAEKTAGQTSASIQGQMIQGNKAIKTAWADRLIVAQTYLPLFIKNFEKISGTKFDANAYNENPQKYYLDNIREFTKARDEADLFIAKNLISKNPLSKAEYTTLIPIINRWKIPRKDKWMRTIFNLTGYNNNDSEVIKALMVDIYKGNGNRNNKSVALAGRISRSVVSQMVYIATMDAIIGIITAAIQTGYAGWKDEDELLNAKYFVEEYNQFKEQWLTGDAFTQDFLGAITTMSLGRFQNIARPIVALSLFFLKKSGQFSENKKENEAKYNTTIKAGRSANLFLNSYPTQYKIGMVAGVEAASAISGLSYLGGILASNADIISDMAKGKQFDKELGKEAVAMQATQAINLAVLLWNRNYNPRVAGNLNKVSQGFLYEIKAEQYKNKPKTRKKSNEDGLGKDD